MRIIYVLIYSIVCCVLSASTYAQCSAVNVPYTQNFESAVVPAMPPCTSVENAGTGNNWTTTNNPGSGFLSKTLTYEYNMNNDANTWFYTRGLNLTAGVAYTLSFRYGNKTVVTMFPERLKVAFGRSDTSTAMTTLIADLNPIIGINNDTLVTHFSVPATGVYYLGFNCYSVADDYILYVDDISVSAYSNLLYASAYLDKNGDSVKQASEVLLSNFQISVNKGADTITQIASGVADYVLLDTGIYTSRYISPNSYYTIRPSSHTTSFYTYDNVDTVAFAVYPIPGIRDISANLIPFDIVRPGFAANYQIIYENSGTDTVASGYVRMIKDSRTTFVSSIPPPASVNLDTIIWNYSSFYPLESRTVNLTLNVAGPPIVAIGDTLCHFVEIFPKQQDIYLKSNDFHLCQVVRGSMDPNDKTEAHAGKISSQQVADGDYLQYTIRFQNTGNDTAFNVYIRDTLDDKLDWNSLLMIKASHDYQIKITDGKNCLWTFSNINLLDSNSNEPSSHGYLTYIIKPKPGIVPGEVISNSAAIYFDFNLPVITNTERTTVVANVYPLQLLSFTAKKSGDKSNLLQWSTAEEINVNRFEVEKSTTAAGGGRQFNKVGSIMAKGRREGNSYEFVDYNPSRGLNYYRLKMINADGRFSYSAERLVDNKQSTSAFTIFPNPARDKLTVTGNNITYITLADYTGRTLIVKTYTSASNAMLDISSLAKGIYVLKMTDVSGRLECRKLVISQ